MAGHERGTRPIETALGPIGAPVGVRETPSDGRA